MSLGTSSRHLHASEHSREGVFEDLKEIQRQAGFISAEAMKNIANKRSIPLKDVHAVVTFYPHFNLKPPAKAEVLVCTDMTCHLAGCDELRSKLESGFRGTAEADLTIRQVSCLGRCEKAPVIRVNENYYDGVSTAQASDLIERAIAGKELPHGESKIQPLQLSADPYDGQRPYEVLKTLIQSRDWDGVIATLKESNLVGMGGAGFPAGVKWEVAKNAPGQPKYVVCNADESEPGTIKDRFILTYLPHLLIESMIVAGLVTGAKEGYIYLRHEYEEQEHVIAEELKRCYTAGILGKNILGSDLSFDLILFMSPGGYICGEGSALLEALEGKRAEPRNKPPNSAICGLWGKPTTLNNVETFIYVVGILANGPAWFKAYGKNGSFGLKFAGVTGQVKKPGVFEVPMGTTYRELIYEYAGGPIEGRKLVGFAPSGPSSGYLPPEMIDLPMDFKTVAKAGSMVGSAAVVVCAEGTCMLDMALNSVKFFRNESCGKCVPCRVGSQKMVDMLMGWTKGDFKEGEMALLDELCHALKTTSICGLGQILPAPIQSVVQHFRADVDEHLLNKRCPAGVCFN